MSEEAIPTIGARFSRRRLLTGAAVASGAAMTSVALPPNVRKALAAGVPDEPFDVKKIEHVVILMQENRSFDHYFGSLSGVRGFDDKDVVTLGSGNNVFYQPDPLNPKGYLLPFHLDTASTAAAAINSTSHDWNIQHEAWNNGAMDSFIRAHIASDGATDGQMIMGYYQRQDIPFHYALAEAFTILDGYHCSVLGPTHPNRFMLLSGTIDPEGTLGGGPALDNTYAGYTWKTYAEKLTEAGVSWRMYNDVNEGYPYNMLNNFKAFADAEPGSELYDRGMAVNYGEFEYDCSCGQLPTVSWIATTGAASEHPNAVPALGAQYLYSKIDAIAANPDLWNSTVFILNYDENDGLFDHVPPLVAPAGTAGEYVTKDSGDELGEDLPVGLGFRVPCIIVSPWTAGGYVFSDVSDHTSVLKFLERITGVEEGNISAWRRKNVSDLTGAFQSKSTKAPTLPDTGGNVNLTTYQIDNFDLPTPPTSDQTYPRQESGTRRRIGGRDSVA